MAIKFVDELPKARRGTPPLSDADIAAIKDPENAGKWALVAEAEKNPAKFVTWVNENDGFIYETRTTKTEKYENSKGKPATRRWVDVYVAFDPENKLKPKA